MCEPNEQPSAPQVVNSTELLDSKPVPYKVHEQGICATIDKDRKIEGYMCDDGSIIYRLHNGGATTTLRVTEIAVHVMWKIAQDLIESNK